MQFNNFFAKLKPMEGGLVPSQRNGVFLSTAKNIWSVGRGKVADVPKDVWVHPSKLNASALHALIYWNPETNVAFIEDQKSLNGTYINGRRLAPLVKIELKEGDQIWLGPVHKKDSCGCIFQLLWGHHSPFLSKYGCETKLGSGSYGDVYKFYLRAQPGSVYAVKVLDYNEAHGRNDREDARAELALLAGEARTHPNICPFIEVFEDETHHMIYIVMQFMPLGDLTQHFDDTVGAGISQLRTILKQVSSGLTHLHAHGIVHRDIKPANIFVKALYPALLVVIGDFGVARRVDVEDGEAKSFVGSFAYMAPEIANMRGYTNKVDSYSAGATAFHLFIGLKHKPFDTNVVFSLSSPKPWLQSRVVRWDLVASKHLPAEGLDPANARSWHVAEATVAGRQILDGLLDPNPETRWSMSQVANFPWIKNSPAVTDKQLQLHATIDLQLDSIGQSFLTAPIAALSPRPVSAFVGAIVGSSDPPNYSAAAFSPAMPAAAPHFLKLTSSFVSRTREDLPDVPRALQGSPDAPRTRQGSPNIPHEDSSSSQPSPSPPPCPSPVPARRAAPKTHAAREGVRKSSRQRNNREQALVKAAQQAQEQALLQRARAPRKKNGAKGARKVAARVEKV
ncbi:unnamed protein product [Peniophora sp. CBMAI 1063]|nr:unnamed protein product [Peniophora sp. CBMAI 1063]